MNLLKKLLGIVWIALGPLILYYLIKTGAAEMAKKPGIDTRMIKPRESWVDDPGMREKIAADGHAAVFGVGL